MISPLRNATMMRRFNALFSTMTLLLLVGAGGGCASSTTIESWQKSVENYVRTEGGGDPSVLRDATYKGDRRGFAVIGANRPKDSTDVTGVLLGNVHLAERPWVVYLVGLVDQQKVSDIRVAALTIAGNKYTWKISKADPTALKAYREYNRGLAHRRFPGRNNEPPEYLGFPRDEDRFATSTEGDAIGVTHPPSGAKWHVAVIEPPKKK
jgi:hypothetical protein